MITKINGEKINTLQELLSVSLQKDGKYTSIDGRVLYGGKEVTISQHWSNRQLPIGLYEVDSNNRFAEIKQGEWFPYVINGVEQIDELGRPISDCNIDVVVL